MHITHQNRSSRYSQKSLLKPGGGREREVDFTFKVEKGSIRSAESCPWSGLSADSVFHTDTQLDALERKCPQSSTEKQA